MIESKRRSVSQLNSFTRCGESYRLERIAKAPATPAAWFAQGSAFHHTAELWERALGDMDLLDAQRIYLAEYNRLIAEGKSVEPNTDRWLTGNARVKGSADIERRADRGWEQFVTYVQYMARAPEAVMLVDPNTPACEWESDLNLDGIHVKLFVDQIIEWPNGIVGPRDLKTGSKRPDWPIQLAVYKLAVEQDFGISVSWGDFYIAKDGRPDKAVNLDRFTKAYITRLFHDMNQAEMEGIYLPNPGDACRTCGVSKWCTAVGDEFTAYPNGANLVGA